MTTNTPGASLPQFLELPVVPVREALLFPATLVPLPITSATGINALEALGPEMLVVVVTTATDCAASAEQSPGGEEPTFAQLHGTGVVARVHKAARSEDGLHGVAVLQGLQRVRLDREVSRTGAIVVRVERLSDTVPDALNPLVDALTQNVRDLTTAIIAASPVLPNELIAVAQAIDEPGAVADFATRVLPSMSDETRVWLIDTTDVSARLAKVFEELVRERERLALRQRITAEVEAKIDKVQRQIFLREQLGAIRKELGEADAHERVLEELRARIESCGMNEAAHAEAVRELQRLQHLPSESSEAAVIRTYLDWISSLPWKVTTSKSVDVARAQQVLDEDHWDLAKVKERVVEYLAVAELRRDLRGPLLCFVGPPGVGKTSVGQSIARASGRAFVRLSLGGIHDEAEIRGHRRTYVGALPGAIIQGLRRAGARDAVFMLDEIDKLGKDFRGDPAAALMEVLDPEQNANFRDHYLDVPFDLSQVLFITTANVTDSIPRALLDRMEVLELPGYAEEDKVQIARRFLVPRQLAENGLREGALLEFADDGLLRIIRAYTREAGVRGLERSIASICRKRARALLSGDKSTWKADADLVRARLGAPSFEEDVDVASRAHRPGVAIALAWTVVGGDILVVETARMPRDRGELTITGHLGKVMEESVRTAYSWVRSNASRYAIASEVLRQSDLHVHVPSGAVPKDGPSAGVVMVIALLSLFTGRCVRPRVAATGEISLAGEVLPVAGLEEKLLAARRAGVQEVIIPKRNEAHVLEDVPEHVRKGLRLRFVSTVEEAIEIALQPVIPVGLSPRAELREWSMP